MKHKTFSFLLTMLMSMVACVASAHNFEVNGIFYKITSSTDLTVSVTYEGDSYSYSNEYTGSVVIPETVTYSGKTYSVTSIGNYAFTHCSGLTSVTIPNSVASIGWYAFSYCSGLTSVTIPNSVTAIGESAFSDCGDLTSVTINSNTIASKSYESSSTLARIFGSQVKEYVFGDEVGRIGSYACYNCTNITSVTIGNSVTSIGWSAFEGCSGLTSVTIGNSVTSIGYDAFDGCIDLTSVTINSNSIASKSYERSSTLAGIFGSQVKEYVFGDGVESIGSYACYNCTNMTSVTIPNSVTSIGGSAFSGCSGLTSVTIPNSVASIGEYAFRDCSALTSVTIPNSVTSIGSSAFKGTAWYNKQSDGLIYAGNIAYEYKGTMPQGTEIILKEGTVGIAGSAFWGCSGLTSVTIPNSVSSIGSWAFSGCSGLTSVTIPDSVTSIGKSAFSGCSGLTSVTIGNSVTSIGIAAFYNCRGLTSVTIPNSVTWIDDGAFDYCSDLTSVTINSNTIASNTYDTSRTLAALFGTQVKEYVFGDGVGSIGSYACYNCKSLTSVTIGNNVTSIGSSVFDGCDACSIYVKKGTASLLGIWAAGYVPYDITTHERLVTPDVEIQESTVTSMKCNLTNLYEEYAYQLSLDGQPVGTTSFYQTGLEPNHEYTVSLTIAENKAKPFVCNVPNKVKVKTAALELTPQQPKVVTEGNVVVEATSNIQNDAEKVGVEWRRVDWTDDFPSNSATAYLFNGTIQGYIRNLNTNYLWKFRSFYESASGNRYYSGWMGIDPTNTSYFEPTVHTYAEHSVEGNSAQVRGYAQRGSENVTAQGFMYWPVSAEVKAHRDGALAKVQAVPADAVQVEAKGTVMQTSLEGLNYNTTYNYVAFMTTSDGETYYGEQQTFTIGEDLTPVESVEVAPKAAGIVAIYDASGRKQPRMQHGVNIVRMSDGTVRKIMVK